MTSRPAPVYMQTNEAELWLVTPGFDDLLLTGQNTDEDGNVFTLLAQADGHDPGAPQPIDVAVQRWMTDGAVASTQGHENRELVYRVVVSASTSVALAAGEAQLAMRSGRVCSLEWTSPGGAGVAPVTVFEVWTWHLAGQFDLDRELRTSAAYAVTMTAKPWVRSVGLTEVAAVATSATPALTSIDTCASLTPATPFAATWTGAPNTPSVVGATSVVESQVISATGNGISYILALTRTGTVSGLGSTPYLVLDATAVGGYTGLVAVRVNGTSFLSRVAQVGSSIYYSLGGLASFTKLEFMVAGTARKGVTATLTVSDISASATVGGIGTALQIPRSLDVGGSVPTSGSIQIASPSATALGTVLLYTAPQQAGGFNPPLRRLRAGSSTTVQAADGSAVSGFHDTMVTAGSPNGTTNFTIPFAQLLPGTYAVVARYSLSTTATPKFTVSALGTPVLVTSVPTILVNFQWGILGVLTLPSLDGPVEASTRAETIGISVTHTGTVLLDEVYLLDITRGDYSLTSTGGTRLWFDAPDVDPVRNRPAVYGGTAADRSDAARPSLVGIKAVGDHDLDPRGTAILVVTDNVANAVVTASFFHRWHTRAGD